MKPEVTIKVEMDDVSLTASWAENNSYMVTLFDTADDITTPRIRSVTSKWTARQLGAILALITPFEDENYESDEILKALYIIAEEVCKNLPLNLRPIP